MTEQLDVLILVQEDCHFCRDAQALLHRLATEYPLRIRTQDMGTAAGERLALQAGLLFPPGILLQGRPLCHGRPSEGKLRHAIDKLLFDEAALAPPFGVQRPYPRRGLELHAGLQKAGLAENDKKPDAKR